MSRLDSVQFDDIAREKYEYLKQSFKGLELTVEGLVQSPAKAIALDKILEASMWVNVAIRAEQISRQLNH